MTLIRRVWIVGVFAAALFVPTGCAEDNEKGVQIKGTSTAPEAKATSEAALQTAPEGKRAVPKGYPGAQRR